MNPLKTRIAQGHPTRAVWCEAGSAAMAEALVYAGCPFLIIDNEHGPASIETTAHMVRAIEAAGGHAMVRVAANDPVQLKRVLEIGVTSIMVPLVESVEEARAAISACRYPPHGTRGLAGDIRAARYGLATDYLAQADRDLFLMLQVESIAGVKAAREIAALEGCDMLFLGPYDLSGSLGVLGQTDHPSVEAAVAELEAVAADAGVPLGTVPRAGRPLGTLMGDPYRLVIDGTELGFAIAALKAQLEEGDPAWTSLSV